MPAFLPCGTVINVRDAFQIDALNGSDVPCAGNVNESINDIEHKLLRPEIHLVDSSIQIIKAILGEEWGAIVHVDPCHRMVLQVLLF